VSIPRRYVDYGGMQSYPAPSSFTDVTVHGFVLEGDRGKVQALVDRMLNEPCGGAVTYVAFSSHVLLSFIDVEVGRFDRYPNVGYGTEHECDLWVPVARVKSDGEIRVAEQVAWFVPYLFVDSSAAIASGREVYGFQKQWGWISMPTPANPGAPFNADVQGTRSFGMDSHIERIRLLEMQSVGGAAPRKVRSEWTSAVQALDALRHACGADADVTLPGLGIGKELLDLLFEGEMPLVFLKQFRDIGGGDGVCYQAITEACARIDRFHGFHLDNEYDLVLQELESHPIQDELGVASQRARLCFDAELDFSALAGRVVWKADL
jgi:hypothetical protein